MFVRVPTPQVMRLLALVLLLLFAAFAAHSGPLQGYRLSAGDRVRISVFGESDLSVSDRISDRGTITYPLLGEIDVEGMTPDALERLIISKLKGPYLIDPQVSVSIEAYREFFVMGQVNSPGGFPYMPGLTVRKAISIAGGFTERASRNKIFLVNENRGSYERKVKQNDTVGPGDTIVVKESFF